MFHVAPPLQIRSFYTFPPHWTNNLPPFPTSQSVSALIPGPVPVKSFLLTGLLSFFGFPPVPV